MNTLSQIGGEQYQRLEHREQIRLRPDTYIGSPAGISSEPVWCAEIDKNWSPPPAELHSNLRPESNARPHAKQADNILGSLLGNIMVPNQNNLPKLVTNPPIKVTNVSRQLSAAVIGISKEVFDNATDNIERSRVEGINPGIVEVEMSTNSLSVKNYGKHIPVVIHHKEKIWVPQLIFGVLLTSDNYDDSISRYKIGRNGYGIKLTNVFSLIFQVIVGDPVNHLKYTQVWQNGMLHVGEPVIEAYDGPGFTQIIFVPDFPYLYDVASQNLQLGQKDQIDLNGLGFLESMTGFFLCRTMEISYAAGIQCKFNSIDLDFTDIEKYFESYFAVKDPLRKQVKWTSNDLSDEFIIADTPGNGFQVGFVNGTPVHQGEHINEYLRVIFEDLCKHFELVHKKKVTVNHLKKHVSMILRVKLDKPAFDSQIKKRLVKPKPKVVLPKKLQKDVMKWELEEELKKIFGMKTKKAVEQRKQKTRVQKINDALMAGTSESYKCTLILTEGETGCTLALNGGKYLPGGMKYNGVYPLRGKIMNIDRHTEERAEANKELSDIMEILKAVRGVDYTKAENYSKLRYGKICFMCDADDDGKHIEGLGINFIFEYLRSIAPFNFTLTLLTPLVDVEHIRTKKVMSFYYHKQFMNWQKLFIAEGGNLDEFDMDYKKGLGSWDADDDKVLKGLFQNPAIITYCIDSETDNILNLVFNKKMTDQRKQWISAFDPDSKAIYVNPRPVTDFFQEEFRSFSKASVIRAIPRLMDGLKPSSRKVLYAMFLKFSKTGKQKPIKIPQFGGFVMEKCQYHHDQNSLFDTISIMGQRYVTGPNNINLVLIKGNPGDRRMKGKDASPARYLKCSLHPIARYVYRDEDWPLLKIQYDEGEAIEPEELYPVIPMCIVNRTEGIGTGWSTKIPPHSPLVVIDWVTQWVLEMKSKRDIPKAELVIDVSTKPDLIPFWKGYHGEIRRIANKPHERFINLGTFKEIAHTVFVTELPADVSIENYKLWLKKEEEVYETTPDKAILRTFDVHVEPPLIDFRIYGMFGPSYEKLKLVRMISMSNMVLIDKDNIPRKFDYIYEILATWCSDRLEIYEKRRLYRIGELEARLRKINLKYLFVMDVVEDRLVLKDRPKEEYIPYMEARGYPCNKKRDGDDFTNIPLKSITRSQLIKLKKEIGDVEVELDTYRKVWAEDLWLKDLGELDHEVKKLYKGL